MKRAWCQKCGWDSGLVSDAVSFAKTCCNIVLIPGDSCGFPLTVMENAELEPRGHIAEVKASDLQIGGTHYKGDPIQHFEYVMKNKIPWGEAAAIKYIIRHTKKNGVQDLDKAMHYLMLVREHYYPEAPPKFKML